MVLESYTLVYSKTPVPGLWPRRSHTVSHCSIILHLPIYVNLFLYNFQSFFHIFLPFFTIQKEAFFMQAARKMWRMPYSDAATLYHLIKRLTPTDPSGSFSFLSFPITPVSEYTCKSFYTYPPYNEDRPLFQIYFLSDKYNSQYIDPEIPF